MKWPATILLFLVSVLFLAGCGNSEQKATDQKEGVLDVYTTVYPLQFFTEQIGGEYVNVQSVYPPGTDEHSFEPSQKDIVKMSESDLFFYIGHNLEGFVSKAKPILEGEGVDLLAVGETVNLEEHDEAHEEETHTNEHNGTHEEETHADEHNGTHEEETHADEHNGTHEEETHAVNDGHNHGNVDPHLWLDPLYSIQMAESIKNELIKQMPEQESYFEDQYKELSEKLTALDTKFANTVENGKTNKIIVSHAAYGYWEERYDLEQISVTGLTSSDEPSQKELGNIIKTAKENDLRYVIFEQNTTSKLTKIIQKELGAKPLHLHNLSVLTDQDIRAGEDYFSLMEKNIKTLQTALY